MSITEFLAQHGGKLRHGSLLESKQTAPSIKVKTSPATQCTIGRVKAHRGNYHHGCIVPAYERPSFRL